MLTTFWDILLLVIGFGTFLCIPILLLAIIGLFLTIAIKSITPAPSPTKSANQGWNIFEGEVSSPDDLLTFLQDEAFLPPTANNVRFPEKNESIPVSKVPTVLQSTLRWIIVILIYAIAFGLSIAMIQAAAESLQPITRILLPVLINTIIIFIGLVGMRTATKREFTDFLLVGWFISFIVSILAGSIAGIFTWTNEAKCVDPVCVYYSEVFGLTVGAGVLLSLIYLVEWWSVWGEKYRTGRWLAGFLVGLSIAILLSAIGLMQFAIVFGWMICALIVASGARGDSFYERRLGGVVPAAFVMGYTVSIVSTLIAAPHCLCVDDINALAWRWLASGAFAGGVSGIALLYSWQVSPINAKAVTVYQLRFDKRRLTK